MGLTIITPSEKHYLTNKSLFIKKFILAIAHGFGGTLALLAFFSGSLKLVNEGVERQQMALSNMIIERDQYKSIAQDMGKTCGQQLLQQQKIVNNAIRGKKVTIPKGIGGE